MYEKPSDLKLELRAETWHPLSGDYRIEGSVDENGMVELKAETFHPLSGDYKVKGSISPKSPSTD